VLVETTSKGLFDAISGKFGIELVRRVVMEGRIPDKYTGSRCIARGWEILKQLTALRGLAQLVRPMEDVLDADMPRARSLCGFVYHVTGSVHNKTVQYCTM